MKFLILSSLFISSLAFGQQGGVFNYLKILPTTIPSYCSVGDLRTNASTDTLNFCTAPNNWAAFQGLLTWTNPLVNTGGTVSILKATSTQNGYLGFTDWNTFNNKQPTISVTAPVVLAGATLISMPQATTSQSGYLGSTDWTTFNGKQAALTLPLSIANGGTNSANALVNNRVIVSAGGTIGEFTPGTSGQFLESQGTGSAPIWGTALSNPMTTAGDIIYGGASGVATRLAIGTGGSVLTVSSGTTLPIWSVSPSTPTNNYYSGYMPNATQWTLNSRTFAYPTNGASNTLTRRFGTITVAAETGSGNKEPAIVFTPGASTSIYIVTAYFCTNGSVANDSCSYQLVDNNNVVVTQADLQIATSGTGSLTLTGIYAPATGSAVTLGVQIGSDSSITCNIQACDTLRASSIEWSLVQIK